MCYAFGTWHKAKMQGPLLRNEMLYRHGGLGVREVDLGSRVVDRSRNPAAPLEA